MAVLIHCKVFGMKAFVPLFLAVCFCALPALADPIYENSVVSNDLDFIRTSDDSVFSCLAYVGVERAEMPDKRRDGLFDNGALIFNANYADGTTVGLWAHSDFGTQSAASRAVTPVAEAIGKLPTFMRATLDHVVIHTGDETAFGEADGHFFVLYADNIVTRLRNNDLEETVFHESVHATLDAAYLRNRDWRAAQRADVGFVTHYAAGRPDKEDMAESALFAWAVLQHPGRLPASIEAEVRRIMPNRLAFFDDLFSAQPIFYRVAAEQGC